MEQEKEKKRKIINSPFFLNIPIVINYAFAFAFAFAQVGFLFFYFILKERSFI